MIETTHNTISAEPIRKSGKTNPRIECQKTSTQMMKDTTLMRTLSHCTELKLPPPSPSSPCTHQDD